MLKALFIVGAAIACLVLVAAIAGYALPKAHVASRNARLAAAPERVFAVLTDVDRYPAWRSDVRTVEVIAREPLRWREHGSNGAITFEVQESSAPTRLVTRIADTSLPFGGTWTFALSAAAERGTAVTITENGEVHNPIFRFMSRFVFGHSATVERYLSDLRRQFDKP
jgi:uncharacterized protein YndB with AHSA1/START domain